MVREIPILLEDEVFLVVNKPTGMPSQGDRSGAVDVVNGLKNNLYLRDGEVPELYLIHRLDRPVGGVMLLARTKEAAAALSSQVENQQMKKEYYAVAELPGDVSPQREIRWENSLRKSIRREDFLREDIEEDASLQGEIADEASGEFSLAGGEMRMIDWMTFDHKRNLSRLTVKEEAGARKAELLCQVLQVKEGKVLFRVRLLTGRHHQIRLQFAARGLPLVGDTKYGNAQSPGQLGLFSCGLSFHHPQTGEEIRVHLDPQGDPFSCFFHKNARLP